MDTIAVHFLEEEQEPVNRDPSRIRQNLRNASTDIFEMDENNFIKNFRLNKIAFKYVLNEIEGSFPKSGKSNALSTKIKLAACLRFFAQGSYQQSVANDTNVNIAQSTFSLVLTSILNILEEKLCTKWIKLEITREEATEAKQHFYRKCQIPGIVMCVDGTHIKILQPKDSDNRHLFYNRKGYFSMNAIIICDHKQRIRYVDGRYQGSNHDSHIWNLSEAKKYFKNLYNNGDKNTRILGDSGYPLEPWLITPFRSPNENTNESVFNKKHSKGRNIVERTIGMLKSRFRCLLEMRALHYEPSKVVQILNVCSALHNICIHYQVLLDDDLIIPISPDEEENRLEESNIAHSSTSNSNEAIEIRMRIMNSL